MLGPHIQKLLKFVYAGVIVGFVSGLVVAALHISNNEYFSYRVYNLILFDLQHYVTKYSAIFILLPIAAAVPILLVNRAFSLNTLKHPAVKKVFNKRVLGAVFISLILAYLIAIVLRYYSSEILSFLRGNALSDLLGQFSDSKRDTRKIYIAVLNIFGLAFIILSTYMLRRFSISERVINALAGAVNSRVTGKIALTLAVVLIIYNIFIFSYKRLYITQSPNVILISLDTLRADHLGSYGYYRDTSPNIDKLAEEGILFENAYSQAPWTLPSMATVHTSLYPTEHGVIEGYLKIKKNLITLAEYMKNDFYKTMAVTTHSFVDSKHGFSQGFDIFDEMNHQGPYDCSSERITQKAVELLADNKKNKGSR